MKKILDIVDMQNSFLQENGILSVKGADKIIPKANDFLNKVPKDFFEYVLIKQDTHFALEYKDSKEAESFPLHCEYKTEDWDLAIDINLLKDKIPIYKLYKNVFDMWDTSSFDNSQIEKIQDYDKLYKIQDFLSEKEKFQNINDILTKYNPKDTEIYLFGVASDFCVKYAVKGYIAKGYKVNILKDLTKGIISDIDKVITDDFSKEEQAKINIITSYKDIL